MSPYGSHTKALHHNEVTLFKITNTKNNEIIKHKKTDDQAKWKWETIYLILANRGNG